MNALRLALSLCAGLSFLAGCGGSQPPPGAPGAMPQTSAIATHAAHGKSGVLPEARGDLLYAGGLDDELAIFSYPKGKHLATIKNLYVVGGICSDRRGNVFVPAILSKSQSTIFEFAHGGTTSIAALNDPGYATACSVDETTGNLAVANDGPTVAIYQGAQGTATLYNAGAVPAFFCDYDSNGNLFVDDGMTSGSLGELPAGGKSFEEITLDTSFYPMSLQWTGGRFVIASYTFDPRGPQPFYNVAISGSRGIVSGPILLSSKNGRHADVPVQFFLDGKTMIGPMPHDGGFADLGLWDYTTGGLPKKIIKSRYDPLNAVTISIAAKPDNP